MIIKLQSLIRVAVVGASVGCVVLLGVCDAGAQSKQLPNHGFGLAASNVPKYDYTPDGRPVMEKRYDSNLTKTFFGMRKFPYKSNVKGLKSQSKGKVWVRQANNILSDMQKDVLGEWGQPDYLRGPYRSTRGDQVNEWAYVQANHIFQFVGCVMVYEGPLTDQDRTLITYGVPSERTVTQSEPGIRHEFWIYRPWYATSLNEKLFKFANGKMIYRQVAP